MDENLKESLEIIYDEAVESWDRFNYLSSFLSGKISEELGIDEESVSDAISDSCGDEEPSFDAFLARIGHSSVDEDDYEEDEEDEGDNEESEGEIVVRFD